MPWPSKDDCLSSYLYGKIKTMPQTLRVSLISCLPSFASFMPKTKEGECPILLSKFNPNSSTIAHSWLTPPPSLSDQLLSSSRYSFPQVLTLSPWLILISFPSTTRPGFWVARMASLISLLSWSSLPPVITRVSSSPVIPTIPPKPHQFFPELKVTVVSFIWQYQNAKYPFRPGTIFSYPIPLCFLWFRDFYYFPFHCLSAPLLMPQCLACLFLLLGCKYHEGRNYIRANIQCILKDTFSVRGNCVQHFFLELSSLHCSLSWLIPFLHYTAPPLVSYKLWNVSPFCHMPWIYVFASIFHCQYLVQTLPFLWLDYGDCVTQANFTLPFPISHCHTHV